MPPVLLLYHISTVDVGDMAEEIQTTNGNP